MAKVGTNSTSSSSKKLRPALTPESREQQMIALAVDLAAKQLQEGTASSQVITHYLKLGTQREKLEREILKEQRDLIVTKRKQIDAQESRAELYEEAIKAMRRYTGSGDLDVE